MIIVNAIICHTPIIVMVYGANSSNPEPFVMPYSIYEKVQVTVFFLQELIISGLYISETLKLMSIEASVRSGTRRIMAHLIWVNIVVVILDITILALEYAGLYDVQTAYKALVYAAKLKLEFSILNQLVELTQGSQHGNSFNRSRTGGHGVALDTFDAERQKRLTRDAKGQVGHTAHAHAADRPIGTGAMTPSDGVMRTTEIVVHRDGRTDEADRERDLESIDTKSCDFTPAPLDKTGGISSSSSEVQFARAGF
jgi:hypothetical protein